MLRTTLPNRTGETPLTTADNPHQQLTQNAPSRLRQALLKKASALPGVRLAPSRISVPGAQAFVLDERTAHGPPEAFLIDFEFAHLHPPSDGSLHMTLPLDVLREVVAKGWGEPHPMAMRRLAPATSLMVYGPRSEEELEIVWGLLQISHSFARGDSA